LDEIDLGWSLTFDEVHPLPPHYPDSRPDPANVSDVPLLNVDRRVSSDRSAQSPKASPDAARKNSAVHVSLSSDSVVKQPGSPGRISRPQAHQPARQRAVEASASENHRRLWVTMTVMASKRVVSPERSSAPVGGL